MGTRRRNQPKHLGRKLKEIRTILNVGQKEMARLLGKAEDGVAPGMVSRFERGMLEPSLIVVLEYARLAGVAVEELIDDELDLSRDT
ncbi:MAG TPA: helix-turn-helix transcriptional regulator [Pyrinomonadaceae bacterium]